MKGIKSRKPIVSVKKPGMIRSKAAIAIDAPEMIELIKNTPAWRTLEIEELSDKHRTPINAYKNKEEN